MPVRGSSPLALQLAMSTLTLHCSAIVLTARVKSASRSKYW